MKNLKKWESTGFSEVPFEPDEKTLRRDPEFVRMRRGLSDEKWQFCKALAVSADKNDAMEMVKGDRITRHFLRKKASEWSEETLVKRVVEYLNKGIFPGNDEVTDEEALGSFEAKFRQAALDPDASTNDFIKLYETIERLKEKINPTPEPPAPEPTKEEEPAPEETDEDWDNFISQFGEAARSGIPGEPEPEGVEAASGAPREEVQEGGI